MKEQVSDFIEKYTVVNEEGKKQINMVAAVIELYARLKSAQNEIRNIHEAIGDVCQWGEMIEKRVDALEGTKKIEIVSELQANKILNEKGKIQ